MSYIVIDSLARSGTTILTKLLGKQNGILGIPGGFPEPLAVPLAEWPFGYAKHKILDESWHPSFNSNKFITRRDNIIPSSKWLAKEFGNFTDIDSLYDAVLAHEKKSHIVLRWNQCVCWINKWLVREDHHWVTIVRNPMDRACSSVKKHSWSWMASLRSTIDFYSSVEQVKSKMLVIYYEDLIDRPKAVLKRILDHAGIKYRDVIKQELYSTSIGTHKTEMPISVQEKFRDKLKNVPLFERYF